jgi:4-amino-4-deoxy-L-arabinose transferase-like glycosyltransferase
MSDERMAKEAMAERNGSGQPISRSGKIIMGLITLAFLLLAGVVSVGNPLFESTDEIRHYRYIRHLVVRRSLPVQGSESVRSQSHHPPLYYAISALLSGWVSSPHTPEYQQPLNPFWGYRNWEVGVDNKLQYYHDPAERFPFREGYLAALIPRWVNVLLGAITVWLTYLLGRRVWRDRPALAWGAAALVAFNPQFIYLSGAMNNDIIAAATGTAVLLLSLEVAQKGLSRDRLALLGLAYGLALLAKFHLVVMGGIIALAVFVALLNAERASGSQTCWPLSASGRWRKVGGQWLRAMAIVVAIAALLAGWWFVRNWWLYGDPTGLNKVNELWAGRPASGNWWALRQGLPYLWSSLWGRFGYGQIPLPSVIYQGLLAFCLLALAGYLFRKREPLPNAALVLLGVTIVGFLAVVTYYILIQPAGPMGRFLFPAFPALAVLVMGGLIRWPILRKYPTGTASGVTLGMGAFAVLALGGYLAPAVRYPPPAPSPSVGQRVELQFADVARPLAVDVQPAAVRPGEPLFVTVTWAPLRQTETPYAVYVHVIDEAGVLLAQRDTWPGLGRAPTTSWEPGRPFADTYRVDLPESAYAPNRATVRVGLYEPTLGRLPAIERDKEPLGDGVVAGAVVIESRPGPWPNSLRANFGDEITLVGYTLTPRSLAAGETFTLTLFWQPSQPQHDYAVFAQVLDSGWNVWGSQDGAGPGWPSNQMVQDVRHITLLPDTPPGSFPVQVGLVHKQTGRLPVIAPEGHHIDDRVLLGPVRVQE